MTTGSLNTIFEMDVELGYSSLHYSHLIFHWWSLGPGADSENLIDAYINTLNAPLAAAISVSTNVKTVSVYNIGDLEDFSKANCNLAGDRAGQRMPYHDCAEIRFPKKNKMMKDSVKRIPYLSEADVNNTIMTPAYLAVLGVLAGTMLGGLTPTLGEALYTYVSVHRIKYITPNGKTAYRLPKTDEELLFYAPSTYTLQSRVTSQVSRKP